jgi:hypothetical protein
MQHGIGRRRCRARALPAVPLTQGYGAGGVLDARRLQAAQASGLQHRPPPAVRAACAARLHGRGHGAVDRAQGQGAGVTFPSAWACCGRPQEGYVQGAFSVSAEPRRHSHCPADRPPQMDLAAAHALPAVFFVYCLTCVAWNQLHGQRATSRGCSGSGTTRCRLHCIRSCAVEM